MRKPAIQIITEIFFTAAFAFAVLVGVGIYLVTDVPMQLQVGASWRTQTSTSSPDLFLLGNDWWPPRVGIKNSEQSAQFAIAEFIISSNEEVKVNDMPAGWVLQLVSVESGIYRYVLIANDFGDGRSEYSLQFVDAAGNITSRALAIDAASGRLFAPAWPGAQYYDDGDNLLALVSKTYRLPTHYQPGDLVPLSSLGISSYAGISLRQEAAGALQHLMADMIAAGFPATIISGYRSYETQYYTYSYWVGYHGSTAGADQVSARPGHSEHQLGTTVDFQTTTGGLSWLAQNAYSYGFVLSYPYGETAVTGYIYEPWHYRYIGVENAAKFTASGLTLIEWLLLQNPQVAALTN